jgi:hypothetical protein
MDNSRGRDASLIDSINKLYWSDATVINIIWTSLRIRTGREAAWPKTTTTTAWLLDHNTLDRSPYQERTADSHRYSQPSSHFDSKSRMSNVPEITCQPDLDKPSSTALVDVQPPLAAPDRPPLYQVTTPMSAGRLRHLSTWCWAWRRRSLFVPRP